MQNDREELKPVDLAQLEQKALAIVDAFRKANCIDRSEAYRKFWLKQAESIAKTHLGDFGYYFDKYKIGGMTAYGMDDHAE